MLLHDKSIVEEDNLDLRWKEVTGEEVDEIIFLSKHTAVSDRPAITVHPIGTISPKLPDFWTNCSLITWTWLIHAQEFLIWETMRFLRKEANLGGLHHQIQDLAPG